MSGHPTQLIEQQRIDQELARRIPRAERTSLWLFTISAIVGLAAIAGEQLIGRALAKPIGVVSQAMSSLADGQPDVSVRRDAGTREVSDLTEALEVFRKS